MNTRPDGGTGPRPEEHKYTAWAFGDCGGGVYHSAETIDEAERKVREYAKETRYPVNIRAIEIQEIATGEIVKVIGDEPTRNEDGVLTGQRRIG